MSLSHEASFCSRFISSLYFNFMCAFLERFCFIVDYESKQFVLVPERLESSTIMFSHYFCILYTHKG